MSLIQMKERDAQMIERRACAESNRRRVGVRQVSECNQADLAGRGGGEGGGRAGVDAQGERAAGGSGRYSGEHAGSGARWQRGSEQALATAAGVCDVLQ